MASPKPPVIVSDLKPESDLLHLLFHRNKNQHRSGKWWKWFGMLRRNLKKLLDPAAAAAGVEARLTYMRKVLVPSCYRAFTSVIPNPSWAPLGLVLLGSLARIHKIIGREKKGEDIERATEVAMVETCHVTTNKGAGLELEDLGEGIVRRAGAVKEKGYMMELDGDDFGEPISRGDAAIGLDPGDFGEAVLRREEVEEEVEEEEEVDLFQKLVTGETPLAIGQPVTKTREPRKEGNVIKDGKGKSGEAAKKKEAIKIASLSPSPPQFLHSLPSPFNQEQPKIKTKRRSEDKEGGKRKKKRRKGDEIDDLFAGLL